MKILLIDDELEYREYLSGVLEGDGHQVQVAQDGVEALGWLDRGFAADVIVSDLMMPRMDGFALLRQLKKEERLPPAILLTAFGSVEMAIATIHDLGGFWFIEKPIDPDILRMLVTRAGLHGSLARENHALKRELSFRGIMGNMVGESPPMQELFSLIRQVAPTTAAVLISGESGTGKELVARALHANSKRSHGPFFALNCASMPEGLMESEIFGHEKGAFTGAVERRAGALEAAEGGTLFLDELSEMPIDMQAKLLRVLEDLKFRRLGGKQEFAADVRILAATNRNPLEAIAQGKLRADLFYRINVFALTLPPLRERKEDIPIIVESLIHLLNKKHGARITGASPAFLELLDKREWKGNVRELRNVVERAVILAGEGFLRPAHLPANPSSISKALLDAQPLLHPPPRKAETPPNMLDIQIGSSIDEVERQLIVATMKFTGNAKTQAAAILGISRKTLHAKLRQYSLEQDVHPKESQ
jgi:DNA-binding NtrC family response regulator